MHIQDYVKNKTQEERQKHIDLSQPCIFGVTKQKSQWGPKGAPLKKSAATKRAKENLLEFLNLKGSTSKFIHTCHKCKNGSNSDNTCVNPAHLYFGTPSENEYDKPSDLRRKQAINAAKSVKNHSAPTKKANINGGIASSKSPKGNINQYKTCPNCGKQTRGPAHYVHVKRCNEK